MEPIVWGCIVPIGDLAAFLRVNVVLIVGGILLGLGGGWIDVGERTQSYVATARILPAVDGDADDSGGFAQTTFMQQRIPEYAAFGSTDSFLERVINQHQLGVARADLDRELLLSSPKDSSLIDITVRADAARAAVDRANATAVELAAVIPEREQLLPVHVTVVEPATLPQQSADSPIPVVLAEFALAGAALGATLAFALAVWRPRATTGGTADDGAAGSDAAGSDAAEDDTAERGAVVTR